MRYLPAILRQLSFFAFWKKKVWNWWRPFFLYQSSSSSKLIFYSVPNWSSGNNFHEQTFCSPPLSSTSAIRRRRRCRHRCCRRHCCRRRRCRRRCCRRCRRGRRCCPPAFKNQIFKRDKTLNSSASKIAFLLKNGENQKSTLFIETDRTNKEVFFAPLKSTSVTKLCENSPIWQNCKSIWPYFCGCIYYLEQFSTYSGRKIQLCQFSFL